MFAKIQQLSLLCLRVRPLLVTTFTNSHETTTASTGTSRR